MARVLPFWFLKSNEGTYDGQVLHMQVHLASVCTEARWGPCSKAYICSLNEAVEQVLGVYTRRARNPGSSSCSIVHFCASALVWVLAERQGLGHLQQQQQQQPRSRRCRSRRGHGAVFGGVVAGSPKAQM